MAITLVGSAKGTTTATSPTMKVGDLMVVCATRNASVTPPTLPADWTLIATKVGTTYSSILAYKYALNPTDISGTWTNATELVMHVYRGSAGKFACIGASASSNGTATPIAYPALTLLNASTSWVACFGGAKGASTTIESPPSGTTLRQDEIATGELASFDTNGVVASWAAHNVTVTGTVTNYIAWSLEIQDKAFTPFGLTQTAYNDVSPASTSSTTTAASFAAAVTSGGFVWGIYSGGNSFAITGVTDDKGNTYNVGSQPAGGGGQLFWLGNITNAPTTITVTVGTTDIFRSMVIQEWSGVFAASDPSDAATAQQHQAAPGTGTDAVTSGSITTVTNGDLILGTYQSDGGLACDIFGGTNFTKTFDNLSNGNTDFAVEARVQATAGAIAATFTQGGTPSANGTEAFVLAVKPAATSTAWAGSAALAPAAALTANASIRQAARASAALASSLTINEDQWYSAKTALAPVPALVSSTGQRQSAVAALAPSTALTGDATRSTIQSASVALAPSTALIASTAQRYAASTALAPSTGLSVNASQVSAFAPYRLVQSVFNDVSPATLSDTTIVCSFAAPVSIGGFVWGIADYASGPALTSVTDDQGNVYNTTVGPTGSNIFWLGHITNAPTTITINLAGASIFRSMAMQEWSGVAAVADPSDGSIAVDQTTPGTGSDAVTTGNITTTFNNDLILGGYISFSGGPEPGLLAGTGYIKTLDNQSTTNTPMALEAQVQTTAAPIAATWTQSAAGEARSYMLAVESATQAWVASLAAAAGAVLVNQTQMLQVARAAVSASAALSAKGNVGLAAQTALLPTVALTTNGKVWGAVRTTLTPATGLTVVGSVEVAAASALAPSVGPNRENLLVDSEFGLAGWVLQHSTITANAGTAPNGTNTAAAFAEDTATSFHYAYQRVAKPLVAQTYTFSCYYKPLLVGTPHVFELDIADQGENIGVFADFDSSGNLVDSGTYGFTLVSAGSAVLDNGWIRAWITGTTNATGIVEVSINVAESGPGDGVSGSYVWGAQLELSSTPSAYIPAINTPSFDFNPQTVIFDSETLAASAGFVATATQAMSAPAALVPATGVVVSASQRQSISAFLSGATACTAVLSPLAAQQWLASALLGPASILGLSTAQMLVGTIAAFAPSAILATNPQVQSPGLVVLAPAAILAATEKMRLVAQAALAPATTASSHASILVAASKALSPVAALAAAQTIAMIAAAESMAALALLVPTARENQGGLAAFNPSNTMSTAEVQRLLAEAGMSGSADLGDAILPVFHGVHSTDNVAEADLASVESMRLKTSTAMPIQTIFAPQAAVQPSFFIHWLNEVVLASSSLQRQAASAALAGIGQTHAGLVQYRAAQSLLNFNIDLRAASTTAHGAFAALDSETTLIETFNKVQSVVSQIGITSNWKTQAGVIRNIKAHLTPALFTDLHIKVRRVRVASATLTGQRQTARIIGRRSNGGVIGQQSPGVIGQQSLDNIIAKGAFQVNLDE